MPKTVEEEFVTLELYGHAPVVYETTINHDDQYDSLLSDPTLLAP